MHKWSHVLVIGQSRPYMICLMQTWSHVLVIGLMYSTASLDLTCFIWDCIFKKSQVSCFIDWCSTPGFNVLDPIPGCDAGHQPHCSGSAAVEVLHQQPQCLIFCISTAAVHWPHSHQIETWGYWTLSLQLQHHDIFFLFKVKMKYFNLLNFPVVQYFITRNHDTSTFTISACDVIVGKGIILNNCNLCYSVPVNW